VRAAGRLHRGAARLCCVSYARVVVRCCACNAPVRADCVRAQQGVSCVGSSDTPLVLWCGLGVIVAACPCLVLRRALQAAMK